jgi:hypothetical protein
MRKRALAATCLFVHIAAGAFADGGDVLLSLPPIAKLGISLWVDAGVLASGTTDAGSCLAAGSVTALLAVPSAFLLFNVVNNDKAGVRLWRDVSIFTDAGMAMVSAGAGAYMIVDDIIHPAGGEDWTPIIGGLLIMLGIPFAVNALLDLVPFPLESLQQVQ